MHVAPAFDSSTWRKAEPPGLYKEFQDSHSYAVRASLKIC